MAMITQLGNQATGSFKIAFSLSQAEEFYLEIYEFINEITVHLNSLYFFVVTFST